MSFTIHDGTDDVAKMEAVITEWTGIKPGKLAFILITVDQDVMEPVVSANTSSPLQVYELLSDIIADLRENIN